MNFKIYKRGQGKYTRLTTAAVVMVLVGFGCWRLYAAMESLTIANVNTKLLVQTLTPIFVFAIFAGVVYWLLNKQMIVDFMINAEGEVKKVNWSSRQEIMVSTTIVIIAVIFFAIFFGLTDVIFQLLFRGIGLLPTPAG